MTENKKFPIPTAEKEDLEEALGLLWSRSETGETQKDALRRALEDVVAPGIYEKLLNMNLVREAGSSLALTPAGENLAKNITRRHRLAERLLSDVLSLEKHHVDENACQLEHIISPEVTDSICTLLGHPTQCPHGSFIPSGPCCARAEERVEPIVISLDKMSPGEEGKISYLLLKNHPEVHKLLALGVVPGTHLRLHQTQPTYVVQLGESQLAMEESVARNIFIRRHDPAV